MQVSSITAHQSTLRWNPGSDALSYIVQYRRVGDLSWTQSATADTFLTVSGLLSETQYEFRVQTQCTGIQTAFTSPVVWSTTTHWQQLSPDVLTTAEGVEKIGVAVEEPAAGVHARRGLLMVDTLGTVGATGPGAYVIWSPQARAFRAGSVSDSSWRPDSLGRYSIALGADVSATRPHAVAVGTRLKADRDSFMVFGFGPVDSLGHPSSDTVHTDGLEQTMAVYSGSPIPAVVYASPGKPVHDVIRDIMRKTTGDEEEPVTGTPVDQEAETLPCDEPLRLTNIAEQAKIVHTGDLELKSFQPCSSISSIRKGGWLCVERNISAYQARLKDALVFGLDCYTVRPVTYRFNYIDGSSPYHNSQLKLTSRDHEGFVSTAMQVNPNGHMSIGDVAPLSNAQLAVGGNMWVQDKLCAKEVNVRSSSGGCPFPDYVFETDYDLLPLNRLRRFIEQNHRLPEMPSAVQVEADGLELGEVSVLLVKKVEELTLYILQQDARIEKLEAELAREKGSKRRSR